MTIYADSHIEFIHHPADLRTLTDPEFIIRQVNPSLIEAVAPELLFLACYVEPGKNAWPRLLWVIKKYRTIINQQGWHLVTSPADLVVPGLKIILHVEDLSAIELDLKKINKLFDLGIRSIGLTHNSQNQFAGGSLAPNVGLKALGHQVIKALFARNILLDFAHLSERALQEVVETYRIAPFLSHTGLFAQHPNPRNISDSILATIRKHDGYLGIGFAGSFLANDTATIEHVIGQLTYAMERIGGERVGIGSDLGGIVSYLPKGLEDIRRVRDLESRLPSRDILGANLLRFLKRVWR